MTAAPLRGNACVAIWTDADVADDELIDWFSTEHVDERLRLPGFLGASLFAREGEPGSGPKWFMLYELERAEHMRSPEYRALVASPSPWSRRMLPRLTGIVRWEAQAPSGWTSGAHWLETWRGDRSSLDAARLPAGARVLTPAFGDDEWRAALIGHDDRVVAGAPSASARTDVFSRIFSSD